MRALLCLFITFSCCGSNLTVVEHPRVLAFEARRGEYVSHGPGYALSVTASGAVLSLRGHALRLWAAEASPEATLDALDRMPGRANYLLGRETRASYDLYGRIRWRGVYPGIDVVFRGNQEHLEYDLEIAAGRDPGQIQLGFDGVDGLRIDGSGDLVLQVGGSEIHQPKPVAYQGAAGRRTAVDVAYRLDERGRVGFRTGAYDRARALVIDPVLVFDHSFGGSGSSTAAGLARDAQGGLYIAGTTDSTDLATVNAAQSHLATAPLLVTANAGQSWSYPSMGGAYSVNAMAAAPSTPLVVYAATPAGILKSADGGTTWTAAADAGLAGAPTGLAVDAGSATTLYAATGQGIFVSTDGGANWRASTSGLSGSGILAIVAHPTLAGTVYASVSYPSAVFRSTDFGQAWSQVGLGNAGLIGPVNGMVFGSSGTLLAATENQLAISTDGGNTWTAGAKLGVFHSAELAIAPNNPAIIYLLSSSGLQRSTDGGQTFAVVTASVNSDYFGAVAVDPRNPSTVYVAAETFPATDTNVLYRSTDGGQTWAPVALPYPATPGALLISPVDSRVFLGAYTQNNVFVTKWSTDGSQVLYSTYLGGSVQDGASGIAVDGNGSAFVTGSTTSPDFPTTQGAFQTKLTTAKDVFVAKLSADGSQLVYSTLLGGDLVEHYCCQPTGSTGIAVDGTGGAVITGFTEGAFPVTANAAQAAPVAGCYLTPLPSAPTAGDAFVTRIAAGGNSLVYSTLLGGSCATNGTAVAIDGSGNAWVVGMTGSPDFPVTADALQGKFGGGMYDGYLARFNPSGGMDYATYVGGAGADTLNAIAFDAAGNLYVTGESGGLSQAASAGAYQAQASASCPVFSIGPSEFYPQGNALVLKLDSQAHMVKGLTYLGAPRCLSGSAIAVDAAGEPWIAGTLDGEGSAPQTVGPFQIAAGNGFVSKFSADFTQLLFSTYFDAVTGLAVDASGLAYVAGSKPNVPATNTSPGTTEAYVAKIGPTASGISLDAVESVVAAVNPSNQQGIAPGEVIRILGKNLGPATAVSGTIQGGVLASTVGGVQVMFDGVAAPLLWVSAQEIDLVAPFALATKSSTSVQVHYGGGASNAVAVGVSGTAEQVLGVFNADFSANSATNPAKVGSTIILYVSGIGQSNPASQDGQINTTSAAPANSIQISWIGTGAASVPLSFVGLAPGMAAGIFQVNFVALQAGMSTVEVVVGAGGISVRVWVE